MTELMINGDERLTVNVHKCTKKQFQAIVDLYGGAKLVRGLLHDDGSEFYTFTVVVGNVSVIFYSNSSPGQAEAC